MKGFAALAIAALVLASIVSLWPVYATHTETPSISPSLVKGGETKVFTLTISHTGGDPIKQVELYYGSFTGAGPVTTILKDNTIYCVDDNEILIPAGTEVILLENSLAYLPEGTVIVVKKDESVYYAGETRALREDGLFKLRDNVSTTENITPDNILLPVKDALVENLRIGLATGEPENGLKLENGVRGVKIETNIVRLTEDARGRVLDNEQVRLVDNVVSFKDNIVIIIDDSKVTAVTNVGWGPSPLYIEAGANAELVDNRIVIPAGTPVQLYNPVVKIPDNVVVIRKAGKMVDVSAATTKDVPENWTASVDDTVGCVRWVADSGKELQPNTSLDFPVALTAPAVTGVQEIELSVRTVDTAGVGVTRTVKITVDSASPALGFEVSKSWVGANTEVTITIKDTAATPEVWTFDNIEVQESNMPEPVVYTLENVSTTDNKSYTLTYTTSDNKDFQGFVTIRVNGAKDLVGNEATGTVCSDKLFVDRYPPVAPSFQALGLTPKIVDNTSKKVVNYQFTVDDDNIGMPKPAIYKVENAQLVIAEDNNILLSLSADSLGYLSGEFSLTEGKHTLKVYFIDPAGNKGEESVDNFYVDINPPVITVDAPTKTLLGAADLPDNKLTIRVKLRDTMLGIENVLASYDDYKENENFDQGYVVVLLKEGTDIVISLMPVDYPVVENVENLRPDVFGITADYTFENTIYLNAHLPSNQPIDGKYRLIVFAGDSMNYSYGKGGHRALENRLFEIDITKPAPPSIPAYSPLVNTNPANPYRIRQRSFTLSGEGETGATVIIYINGVKVKEVPVEDGKWSVDLTDLEQGKPLTIEAKQRDRAGNEGSLMTFGTLFVDASSPTITITEPAKTEVTTDKATILVKGKVSFDSWETAQDIELTVQCGTFSTPVPLNSDGSFTVSVKLEEGLNAIALVAEDPLGNRSSVVTISVNRTVTPWATYATILVIIALVLAAVAIFRKK
ncbi:MAG: hypothetical protein QW356_07725 [Candidatus Hadarchaeales archaeon]